MTDKCGITEYCEMRMGDSCTLGSPCPHQEPLTNEEWFCRLSTEEKADLLSELVWWIHPSVQGGRKVELTKESFLRWLKEKHE